MDPKLESIINAIAEDTMTLAYWVMDLQGLEDSRIKLELDYQVEASDNPMIRLLFNDYLVYIEQGRKANSTMPPLSAIRDWALRKGLPVDNKTLHSIARSIARNGIRPRPIIADLIEELEKAFEIQWADDLFKYIVDQLSDLFQD